MDIRTILTQLDLMEAQYLDASTITKRSDRFDKFISHIQQGNAFYTDTGQSVVAAAAEADRFKQLMNNGEFKGTLSLTDTAGTTWPLSKFLKTPPFGQAVPPGFNDSGADGGEIGKEALVVKPSQIGIIDHDIRAGDLSKELIGSTELADTEYGKAIIEMAKQITSGNDAVIPAAMLKQKNLVAAIVDYAGEYLGVLALIHNTSDFPKRSEFIEWLGGSISELNLYFPGSATTPLADSFAVISNPDTQRQINISSKGQHGGAAPSLSNLVVPAELRKKSKFRLAVDLIDLTQNTSVPKPASVSQVFLAMNLLEQRRPELVPAVFKPFLPWEQSIVAEVMTSVRNKNAMPRYENITAAQSGNASDGGKLAYEVKKAVMRAFNSGEVSEFQSAVLEILDFNFIQQYTDVDRKTGKLRFVTQWPAKLDGVVSLESKSSGSDPTKGGFSFKLKPAGSATSEPDAPTDNAAPTAITGKRTSIKPRAAVAAAAALSSTITGAGGAGREMR
jgi:hypothetical protein